MPEVKKKKKFDTLNFTPREVDTSCPKVLQYSKFNKNLKHKMVVEITYFYDVSPEYKENS